MYAHTSYHIFKHIQSNVCLITTSTTARQLKNTRLQTIAATLFGELKLHFSRMITGYINECRLNIIVFLILWLMMSLAMTTVLWTVFQSWKSAISAKSSFPLNWLALCSVIYTPGKRSTCTPSVYYRKSIWLVTIYHLTCVNKHVAGKVSM